MFDFEAVSKYRVLLVGDAIMDEYRYVVPLGKSIKDNAISTWYERTERFEGGVVAAGRHVANLCRIVDIWHDPEMMWNVRYVEDVSFRKLFTIHESKRTGEAPLSGEIGDYDVVIVTDFGHGALSADRIRLLCERARFLAVNTQTNSTNYGFNVITKYPRADYVVLDELEARLAMRDRDSPIESLMADLSYPKIVVTLGSNGAIGWSNGVVRRARARTNTPVDTMGAGDAFLCISALFAKAGASLEELLHVGNAAAAIKCGIVGHRRSISKEELQALCVA